MTEENRVLGHLFNIYDVPAGENPKENNLNENKPIAAGYKTQVIFFKIQGSQFFLCETDKSWTKALQQAVPGLLRNSSSDNSQQNCCAEQDADLDLLYSQAASYL